jgi:hypothetical protein
LRIDVSNPHGSMWSPKEKQDVHSRGGLTSSDGRESLDDIGKISRPTFQLQ